MVTIVASHGQTLLQVAIDASTLFQEDSRITVNCQQTVQHTLTVGGRVYKSHDLKCLHSIHKIIATQSLCNKTHLILKQCFPSAVHKVDYNFTTEVPIRASIVPIHAQRTTHSDGTNSICASINTIHLHVSFYAASCKLSWFLCYSTLAVRPDLCSTCEKHCYT